MNVKRRHRGLGYYQIHEQMSSEGEVLDFLYAICKVYQSTKSGFDPENPTIYGTKMKGIHRRKKRSWEIKEKEIENVRYAAYGSIRLISRQTGLSVITIRKALDRLKKQNHVIEIFGRNNRRLFCPIDSETAQYLKKQEKDTLESWGFFKLNDPHILKKISNDLENTVFLKRQHDPIRNKILTKNRTNDRFNEIYSKSRKKRQSISEHNKEHAKARWAV